MSQNVLVVGGSRNIGYFSALRLLESGATTTFLLRSPSVFDKDELIQGYIKSGKAHIVKGDALVEDDVQRAWNEVGSHGSVDLLLFTVGGTPTFNLRKGFTITPENLVTQSLLNVLCTMPHTTPEPKIITISSTGLTRSSHAALPLPLKPMYRYLLTVPHKDKVGAERVISHCAGWDWKSAEDNEPGEEIMGSGDWTQRPGLPAAGTLKQVLVVRPALLTDGECLADGSKKSYRVSEGEVGGWTVSRKDVAHFVVDAALNRWHEFENKIVSIAY